MTAVEEYKQAIRAMLATEGLAATNKANHEALERRMINMEQFRAGAQILAAEVINRR